MAEPQQTSNPPGAAAGADTGPAPAPAMPARGPARHSPDIGALLSGPPRRFSATHAILLLNILVIALLVGLLVQPLLGPATSRSYVEPSDSESFPEDGPAAEEPPATPSHEAAPPAEEGLSWAKAEEAFRGGDYRAALGRYTRLQRLAEGVAANKLIGEFFRLRAAACKRNLGKAQEANDLFLEVAQSRSPVVRAVANYHVALLNISRGEYFPARMRAYQALAALGPAEKQPGLDVECDFLAAQALSQKALSFFKGAATLPWGAAADVDPFAGLDEAALRALLADGADRMNEAALGPDVRPVANDRGARRWCAVSSQAPLEDFCARLAAEANLDIRWEGVDPALRRRPVTLYLRGLSEQRILEVACGSAGLLARFTGEEALVLDPQVYGSTAEQRDLLRKEALSTWRRFFLRNPDDARAAQGHFAVATLGDQSGDTLNAMAEYRLVAQKYPKDPLAALSRLRSATLRIALRDYTGARDELLDLLNRYPDCPSIDEVYLRLGHATMEAGHLEEAGSTFRKLYYLDLSSSSRLGACLGCGEALHRKGQHDEAALWLTRFLVESKSPPEEQLVRASFLLAKSEAARGRLPEAAGAFERALAAKPSKAQRAGMLMELAQVHYQLRQYAAALTALDRLGREDLQPAQADEAVLLRAQILRAMHLQERASGLLARRVATASSGPMQARMTLEVARCHLEAGQAEQARQLLAETLPKMEPGPLAHGAAIDLANACLKSNAPVQAAAVCRELLKLSCSQEIRKQALEALGSAYTQQGDYERAALAYAGLAPEAQGALNP